jgi:hypothetical protein
MVAALTRTVLRREPSFVLRKNSVWCDESVRSFAALSEGSPLLAFAALLQAHAGRRQIHDRDLQARLRQQ